MSTGVRRSGGSSWDQNDELEDYWEKELRRRPEVRIINNYVLVMVYIRIGLKGVGALALLWATVVLLGGFVSSMGESDFWSVTIIAFLQAAGLADGMGDGRMAFFVAWVYALIQNTKSLEEKLLHERTHLPMRERLKRKLRKTVYRTSFIAGVVILSPVASFAFNGPMVCFMVAKNHIPAQDYYNMDGQDARAANMYPALKLFYYLSAAHGAMCILFVMTEMIADPVLVKVVSQRHGFSAEVLLGYLYETKKMRLNNPASTDSWNLITYGAGLLDSQLPEDYASGGSVLTMLIDQDTSVQITRLLIRSPRHRIQKLIGALAWRSPADREMRWLAARIVEHLAGHLNLAQFPGALECISSLFDTCHNNGDQEVLHLPFAIGRSTLRKRKLCHAEFIIAVEHDSKLRKKEEETDEDLVLPGLRILENLAHDRHNCALIYNTKDLLSKIVAPVSCNKLLEDIQSNISWTKVVDGSLKVVSRLMSSPGSTGKEMCSLIADDENAANNLEALLDMDMKSNSSTIELQMRAIEVLTQLVLHHPASFATERRVKLIERLLHIFVATDWIQNYLKDEKREIDKLTTSLRNTLSRLSTQTRLHSTVKKVNRTLKKEKMDQATEALVEKKMKEAQQTARRLKEKAGEALAMLSSDSEVIKSFTGSEDVVNCLTELLNSKIKTIKCKISATDTVEIEINTGCRISAAVILKNLSKYVKEPTLWKVLDELLPIQAEASSTPGCWERVTVCIPSSGNDIENPSGGGQAKPSAFRRRSHIQQCRQRRLQAELLSLVAAVRANGNVNFSAILQPAALEDFVVRLKKMVEDSMYATPACLAIQKLTCEMVIGFIPHGKNFAVIEKHDIVGTLLKASKRMAGLESSMIFAGVDRDCHGVALRPLSSDLAKQAQDILTQRKRELGIGIVP